MHALNNNPGPAVLLAPQQQQRTGISLALSAVISTIAGFVTMIFFPQWQAALAVGAGTFLLTRVIAWLTGRGTAPQQAHAVALAAQPIVQQNNWWRLNAWFDGFLTGRNWRWNRQQPQAVFVPNPAPVQFVGPNPIVGGGPAIPLHQVLPQQFVGPRAQRGGGHAIPLAHMQAHPGNVHGNVNANMGGDRPVRGGGHVAPHAVNMPIGGGFGGGGFFGARPAHPLGGDRPIVGGGPGQ